MLSRLSQAILPPQEIDNRTKVQSWLLTIFLVPTMAVTLVVGFIDPSLGSLRFAALSLFGLEVLVALFLRLGKIRLASLTFVASTWLVVAYLSFMLEGLNSAVLYFSLVILLLSGILLSDRFALLILSLNIAFVTALFLMERNGWMPTAANPTTPLRRWAVYLGTFLLVSVLVHISQLTYRRALQRAKTNERELLDTNQELKVIQAHLEQRVEDRTRALERRAAQFQAAAEIGRAGAMVRSNDELLQQAVHLISEKFGFYHVGIFLLDTRREYAVLQAANSQGGERMLARSHRLKVGQAGIVGFVAQTSKPRIALDVGQDVTYFNNPDLPETRSEMALPLKVGQTMIGVLDVQSREPDAFSQEDISAMQMLADLLAVSIQNTRLLSEQESALEAARRAYQEISQESWQKFLAQRQTVGFISTSQATRPARAAMDELMHRAFQDGQVHIDADSLALPIQIRSNTTGVLRVKKDGASNWGEKELEFLNEFAQQLSQTLETARLYSETRQRAERERLTADIVNRMRETNDPQIILNTALAQLQQALGVRKASVQLENGQTLAVSGSNGHANDEGWESS